MDWEAGHAHDQYVGYVSKWRERKQKQVAFPQRKLDTARVSARNCADVGRRAVLSLNVKSYCGGFGAGCYRLNHHWLRFEPGLGNGYRD